MTISNHIICRSFLKLTFTVEVTIVCFGYRPQASAVTPAVTAAVAAAAANP